MSAHIDLVIFCVPFVYLCFYMIAYFIMRKLFP